MYMRNSYLWLFVSLAGFPLSTDCRADERWLDYAANADHEKTKRIVLICGDEEYRSEEALPQLAKILASQHGFQCRVLFAIDEDTGIVNPNNQRNIPGLEALGDADLMVLFTRFRALPHDQMAMIDAYVREGKPILGIRTSTHAFNFPADHRWAHYGNGYSGDKEEWTDGFGRLVLGEKWISHHGSHKHESTRGIIAAEARQHPIVRGLGDGDVWGPTDVYGVRLPLPGDATPVVLGQVTARAGKFDEMDVMFGMRDSDPPDASDDKNNPMMPIAWTKSYQVPGGRTGRAFMSTIGSSTDLSTRGTRRLLVNAVYWCLGMEDQIPPGGSSARVEGEYVPSTYSFRSDEYWQLHKYRPSDFDNLPSR